MTLTQGQLFDAHRGGRSRLSVAKELAHENQFTRTSDFTLDILRKVCLALFDSDFWGSHPQKYRVFGVRHAQEVFLRFAETAISIENISDVEIQPAFVEARTI